MVGEQRDASVRRVYGSLHRIVLCTREQFDRIRPRISKQNGLSIEK